MFIHRCPLGHRLPKCLPSATLSSDISRASLGLKYHQLLYHGELRSARIRLFVQIAQCKALLGIDFDFISSRLLLLGPQCLFKRSELGLTRRSNHGRDF